MRMGSSWKIIGGTSNIEVIAAAGSVRDRQRLVETYGDGRWRKLKGLALVEFRTAKDAGLRSTGTRHMA